jgi:hypothetical protein
MTTEYEFHKYADLFPLMDGDAFEGLVQDIRTHGLREPIILHEGKVLDGRNRQRAALEAGIELITEDFDGTDEEALDFVFSMNIARRHLSVSQRAMIASEIETMRHGGDRKSDQSASLHDVPRVAAARKLDVSTRSVASAAQVRDHAIPELAKQVKTGNVTVSAAATVSSLPEDEQHAIVAEGPAAIVKAAAEVRTPVSVKESWAADILRGANIHDSARDLIKNGLVTVVGADDGNRDDIAADLGNTLDFIEGVVGDVVEGFRGDEGLLAKITEAAFTKTA